MLLILVLITIISGVLAEEKNDPFDVLVDFSIANADKSAINFQVFSEGDEVGIFDHASINQANQAFNKKLNTKFLVHGFNESPDWYDDSREAYEEKGFYNVVYVNWSKAAFEPYPIAAANTKIVGESFADFIIGVGLDLEKIHLIGHSMGSHICGFVGKSIYKRLGEKISRISGLDPARPGFKNAPPDNRLVKNDALMLDVVHTDIKKYGYPFSIGHVDYYANGGFNQPKCDIDKIYGEFCNHKRSYKYFIESITTKVKAYPSKSWEEFQKGKFDRKHGVTFGENLKRCSKGEFYLKTRDTSPFLKK